MNGSRKIDGMDRLTGIRILALGVVLWAIATWLFGTTPPATEDMVAEPAAPAEGQVGTTAVASAGTGADAAGEEPSLRTGVADTSGAGGARTAPSASDVGAGAGGAGIVPPASGTGAGAGGAGIVPPAPGTGAGIGGAGIALPAPGTGAGIGGAGIAPSASRTGAEIGGAGIVPPASGTGAGASGAGIVPSAPGTTASGSGALETAAATTPGTDMAGVPPAMGVPSIPPAMGAPITVPDADEVGMEALAGQIVAARRAAWEGRLEDALAHYRAAARIRPWSHVIWGEMGNVLWMMRRWHEAAYALEGAATLLVDAGEFRAASDLLPAVGQLDPEAAHRVQRRLWIVSQPPPG